MGLLDRLRGRREPPPPPPPIVPADWIERRLWASWEAPRNYVAGEQSYLATLTEMVGSTCREGYCLPVAVTFLREPDNRYDSNAFRAEVHGRCVGHLRRHVAADLAWQFDEGGIRALTVCGIVRGGSTRAPMLGVHVWLDRILDPPISLKIRAEDPQWAVPWPPRERDLTGSA